MKRNNSTTTSFRCQVCNLHMTNDNAVCAYCEDIANLRTERWSTELREARSAARLIADDLNERAVA